MSVCEYLGNAQDLTLKEIVNNNLIGQYFIEVKVNTDSHLVVQCDTIVNRCLYIPNKDDKGYLTWLDTPYEHD